MSALNVILLNDKKLDSAKSGLSFYESRNSGRGLKFQAIATLCHMVFHKCVLHNFILLIKYKCPFLMCIWWTVIHSNEHMLTISPYLTFFFPRFWFQKLWRSSISHDHEFHVHFLKRGWDWTPRLRWVLCYLRSRRTLRNYFIFLLCGQVRYMKGLGRE